MAELKVDCLSIEYAMQTSNRLHQAIHNVNFRVKNGEFVAIVGPSGSGKTTLLHAVAGLLAPTSGRIVLAGREVTGPGKERALVFQTSALLPWRTVLRNVAYGLELHGHHRRQAEARARAYLELVGLGDFAAAYPHELSGGMQQRANLARALAVEPRVLLFDEPLSALDAQTREHMQSELQRIWLQNPTTTVYVTHQIDEALFLADRVIVMSPSPGSVKAILPVDFPRPRTISLRRSSAFRALEDEVWQQLDIGGGFKAARRME